MTGPAFGESATIGEFANRLPVTFHDPVSGELVQRTGNPKRKSGDIDWFTRMPVSWRLPPHGSAPKNPGDHTVVRPRLGVADAEPVGLTEDRRAVQRVRTPVAQRQHRVRGFVPRSFGRPLPLPASTWQPTTIAGDADVAGRFSSVFAALPGCRCRSCTRRDPDRSSNRCAHG